MELLCAPCTDQRIADGQPDTLGIPPAVTIAPQVQVIGSTPVAIMLPVCYQCRQKQLAPVSKAGLVTA